MDRWNWVMVRAFGPAAVALLVAMLTMAILSHWQATPLLAELMVVGRWIPLLALVASLWLLLAPIYRLWQWQRGKGPNCPRCDGPLGYERAGYASRGGAYRRCYACGDNVNHRHYE
ncbi:hypothetical protein [Lysobacter enzymogenes]|uniref:hypothetical protein n=1 Tax=Lysobacter enzymogenes TaxID=69 RepID=UPI0008981B57|nr:hypothetical protein [Lysobacter enzymogenes]SDX70529.1 hypothetical protein SAMN05421681_10768 [Lysobacter enzymogenes]